MRTGDERSELAADVCRALVALLVLALLASLDRLA